MPEVHQRSASVLQAREWADRGRLFAVIDATGIGAVPPKMRQLGATRAVSLYQGRAEEELWAIAPYLCQVDPSTLDWIAADLWAAPWGVFALTDASLDALRKHLRRLLVVEAPNGESWYFRFYDPRVLPKFLTVGTGPQIEEIFGPVRAFAVTDPDTYGLQVFAPGPAAPSARTETAAPLVVRR
jgi:Domain of unknown function (DUF4123)